MEGIFKRDGKPMLFYMENCAEKQTTEFLVNSNGGKFLKRPSYLCIHLYPVNKNYCIKGTIKFTKTPVSYKFVHDSTALKKLLDLTNYQLKASVEEKLNLNDSEKRAVLQYAQSQREVYNTVEFWQKALESGLEVDSPPSAIKEFYESASPQKRKKAINPEPPFKKPKQATILGGRVQAEPSSNSPGRLSQLFDEPSELLITVEQNERVVRNMSFLQKKCQELNVIEQFKTLQKKCTQGCGTDLEPKLILDALSNYEGDTEKVLTYFSKFKPA